MKSESAAGSASKAGAAGKAGQVGSTWDEAAENSDWDGADEGKPSITGRYLIAAHTSVLGRNGYIMQILDVVHLYSPNCLKEAIFHTWLVPHYQHQVAGHANWTVICNR